MDKNIQESPEKPGEGKFSYEAVQDSAELVAYLRALTDGFEKGTMRFARKGSGLTLNPKGLITFMVEAKGKDGRMKLNLKFTWRESSNVSDLDEGALIIETRDAGCDEIS